jgi:glutamyl-tRNA reductase
MLSEKKSISDFWLIGINYRKSDTTLRGRYAINNEQYDKILKAAPEFGLDELFILSTCNRTEIYGFTKEPLLLMSLLCNFTEGAQEDFIQAAYQKNGKEALSHIFHVAGGLDSQILGDYEIIFQMKNAINFASERGFIGQFTDRLFKTVLQSCRAIRSKTHLSEGTVSVAFAAVQFLKNHTTAFENKKMLLIGSGKIGRNVCKNLVTLVPSNHITLINRTSEKAEELAAELNLNIASFDSLSEKIKESDIIIVATNAAQPILERKHLQDNDAKILIDLSIPNNIHPEVKTLPHIVLANVDDLSKINDDTLQRREAELPQAKAFITFYIHQFAEWYLMRQHVPVLKAVKEKLTELNHQLFEAEQCGDNNAMQKTINNMALKMRSEERRPGCNYIEALNGYLSEIKN